MVMANTRNNGRKSGITAEGVYPGTFSQGQMTSVTKMVAKLGDASVEDLLAVCNCPDMAWRNAVILTLAFIDEFDLAKRRQMLRNLLAASDSIDAERTKKLQELVWGFPRDSKNVRVKDKPLQRYEASQSTIDTES